ncbi:hypothetical protein Tco_1426471 [Tanacetum coccineum]
MFDETATTLVQCSADSILEVDDEKSTRNYLAPYTDTLLYNRLARHPSVSTPTKPSKERKHKRVELEDSDTDATPVTDEEAKDATTGCSSGKIKKKRYIIDDSVSD